MAGRRRQGSGEHRPHHELRKNITRTFRLLECLREAAALLKGSQNTPYLQCCHVVNILCFDPLWQCPCRELSNTCAAIPSHGEIRSVAQMPAVDPTKLGRVSARETKPARYFPGVGILFLCRTYSCKEQSVFHSVFIRSFQNPTEVGEHSQITRWQFFRYSTATILQCYFR